MVVIPHYENAGAPYWPNIYGFLQNCYWISSNDLYLMVIHYQFRQGFVDANFCAEHFRKHNDLIFRLVYVPRIRKYASGRSKILITLQWNHDLKLARFVIGTLSAGESFYWIWIKSKVFAISIQRPVLSLIWVKTTLLPKFGAFQGFNHTPVPTGSRWV